MPIPYKTYKDMNWPAMEEEVLAFWKQHSIFNKSVEQRQADKSFVFYEGPPSANGMPGIHHVMSRTIKDIFCRYKTLKGYRVERKGGWDTHGLPVELQVEKRLGITKEDIGKSISVAQYNKECREDVMKFKDKWDELTERIAYWVDLDNPYVTYENEYIESVWYLLKQLHQKELLYKGYTIQPYSPAAGTGLSSHELNQPGTYKMVKDTTVVAQFKADENTRIRFQQMLQKELDNNLPLYFLAWTTTPWTLPSNTALAVGPKINYLVLETTNTYTSKRQLVVIAKELAAKYFKDFNTNTEGTNADCKIIGECKGTDLIGMHYEQLMPFDANNLNGEKAFEVILGDFVTTEDGTGIVHIAPSFGSDDFRVAAKNRIASLTMVDKQGKFVEGMGELSGKFVKNYNNEDESAPDYKSADVWIAIKLKEENKAFKVEKYEHSYPHCWRTDKPVLYYPLESWFVKTTAVKDKLVAHNRSINWKPKSTGEGRFGNWLENLVDWNLSRSRYWGTPLPIWRTDDGQEEICIGSIEELLQEVNRANTLLGTKQQIQIDTLDLHKPFVDEIVLVSPSGKPMRREPDLIDVWFDSGSMPYAQHNYKGGEKAPFGESKQFPADFIAEGVDQTRGWFFTLHAIAVMLFDSAAYKNVLANGLVLDKNGNKMSKRLGNAIDPFETVNKYGADAVRWYMLSNAAPWENLKFDLNGVLETQRKFFGTLYNTYSFFALYANIDGFAYKEQEVEFNKRPEIDRWILSLLNSLVKDVEEAMDDYDPTVATRAIQDFVTDNLSNWYVRLCRRRFWKGDYSEDKISAYQTLYTCLEKISVLMSSFAPFYAERLFTDLNAVSQKNKVESVHLTHFPVSETNQVNTELEQTMKLAQDISSLVLGLRKKNNIKVRQPLQKIMVPVLDKKFGLQLKHVEDLILAEVNVKELQYLEADNDVLVKKIKPNFKSLGKKVGSMMKEVTAKFSELTQNDIKQIEENGVLHLNVGGKQLELLAEDVEISSQDIPGWLVATDGLLTVALDVTISDSLKLEGHARELVNRLQNLRKDKDFDVTDTITVRISVEGDILQSIIHFKNYICTEILATEIDWQTTPVSFDTIEIDGVECKVEIIKN